mmetsp:Transcript_56205/g.147794  ORF Transcript_56205/g.147794 Transcript_56205/m.147794 type:complete len:296 (+) Transcript_56205:230-1117(+)
MRTGLGSGRRHADGPQDAPPHGPRPHPVEELPRGKVLPERRAGTLRGEGHLLAAPREVPPGHSETRGREACRRAALRHHPDKQRQLSGHGLQGHLRATAKERHRLQCDGGAAAWQVQLHCHPHGGHQGHAPEEAHEVRGLDRPQPGRDEGLCRRPEALEGRGRDPRGLHQAIPGEPTERGRTHQGFAREILWLLRRDEGPTGLANGEDGEIWRPGRDAEASTPRPGGVCRGGAGAPREEPRGRLRPGRHQRASRGARQADPRVGLAPDHEPLGRELRGQQLRLHPRLPDESEGMS